MTHTDRTNGGRQVRPAPGPSGTPVHEVGEGSPLLLIHGVGGTWRVWRPVLPGLERLHVAGMRAAFLVGGALAGCAEHLPGAHTPGACCWGRRWRTPFEHYGRAVMDRLPGAELMRMSGAGHVPMSDDPVGVVERFLEVTRPLEPDTQIGTGAARRAGIQEQAR